jgi:hypothetical protein
LFSTNVVSSALIPARAAKDRHAPEASAQSVKLWSGTDARSAALASTHTGAWGTGIWSVALEKNRVKELPSSGQYTLLCPSICTQLMRVKNLANVSLGLKYTMRVKNLAKYAIDESSAS